ncbi:MAG TPA: hypothetical protein VGM88_23970 [Kofleriaceae bacterium]
MPARADTRTDDIKNGTELFMHYAHVTVDGVASEGVEVSISKAAGTLTFDIPGSLFGIYSTQATLHAIGTAGANGQIVFTTANTYSPPLVIDAAGDTISSETGTFTMMTRSLDGGAPASCGGGRCPGGTDFEFQSGALVVTGSFGTKVVTLDDVRGMGGVARQILGGMAMPPTRIENGTPRLPFCSSATGVSHAPMKIDLAGLAPAGDQRVDLSTTTPGIALASTGVRAGRDTMTVDMLVPANFSGPITVTAGSGGTTTTTTLTVQAPGTCHAPSSQHVLAAIAPGTITGVGGLDNLGDALAAVSGVVSYVEGGVATHLAAYWGVQAVAVDAINDHGQIAGLYEVNGVTQAFRADMKHGAHQPLPWGQMTPAGITPGGTVFGYRTDPATGLHVPVYNNGGGVKDLALTATYGVKAARILFMLQDGTMVGTYTGNDGVIRGFKRSPTGSVSVLPQIGTAWSQPVGLADDGSIAVTAGTAAAVLTPSLSIQQLAAPTGYTHFVPKAINKWGYVVGTATSTGGLSVVQRAFVYKPGVGMTALSGYVAGYTIDDSLAINADNQILVHGITSAGATNYYMLTL